MLAIDNYSIFLMAMKNVVSLNSPIACFDAPLLCFAMFIVLNKMRSTVQWLTKYCFKHAQVLSI